jgi:hypothetical protein
MFYDFRSFRGNFYFCLVTCEFLAAVIWGLLPRRKAPKSYVAHETPRSKIILYRSISSSEIVRAYFREIFTDESVKTRLIEILGAADELTWSCFAKRIDEAKSHLVKPSRPGRVFAWAQAWSISNPTLLVGFEPFLLYLKPVLDGAIGHELAHCAQEIREGVLTKEWNDLPSSGLRRWFRIELEAHLYFLLWPLLVAIVICIHWLLAFWSAVWS